MREPGVIKDIILESDKSRCKNYREINSSLTVHQIYYVNNVPEYKRKAFSRFRLSSHTLNIEKLRWRNPIIPADLRFCTCSDDVKNERHIITNCELRN